MQEELLRIYVRIDNAVTVEGNSGTINMLHFSGRAESKYFQGEILPGGVDLQRQDFGGAVTLSARYILEGMDMEGRKCKMFIENNGSCDSQGVMQTVPKIITDSKALAWIEMADLTGTISSQDGMVIIYIFANS